MNAPAPSTAPSEVPESGASDIPAPKASEKRKERTATGLAPPACSEERLHRCKEGRMLAGVAVGLADYFDVDPTLVRIGFVALSFLGGLAVPLYLAGWLLIPEDGAHQSVAEELLAGNRAH